MYWRLVLSRIQTVMLFLFCLYWVERRPAAYPLKGFAFRQGVRALQVEKPLD